MSELTGIIPPLTTPFDEHEEINEQALRAEVRHLIGEAKVHGLAVGGSTGEGHTLTTDELRHTVAVAIEEAAGRVPVVAGVIVDSTRQAKEKAAALADLKVAALQVTPVHYLFKPNDEMMLHHFAAMAEVASSPIIIYNVVPWTYCSPELLTHIISEVDEVIGVKQSAGDMKLLADLLLQAADKAIILSAVDALLYPSFTLGAHGAIAAILTAAPTLCVDLWNAVEAQDHAKALSLHQHLLPIWNAIMDDNLPANVKTAMELQGRPAGLPRSPMQVSSKAQKDKIHAALSQAGVKLEAALV